MLERERRMDAATSPLHISTCQPRETPGVLQVSHLGLTADTLSTHNHPLILHPVRFPRFCLCQVSPMLSFLSYPASVSALKALRVCPCLRERSLSLYTFSPHPVPLTQECCHPLLTLSYYAFIFVRVRVCRQALCVALGSITCVPVDPARGSLVSVNRYWLGAEGRGHIGIVGGLYMMLRVLQAMERLLHHPSSTHLFR